ncbi:MAG: 3-isopropylmalate dehydratase small subunit [Candidatus Omnitrophica bacterium]|nr:3-isopropylmalate dehydratase small subunit [Candidatus Omnitrophota bacterium]
MKIKGKVHKFGNNVNTDEIIPASYLNTTDPGQLARHCMEGIDKNFSKIVKRGDVIVAGRNFGCGSSREHAPLSIKGAGVSCVIGRSFARIFYRNCINIGLPILESKEAARRIRVNDRLKIDTKRGTIEDITLKKTFYAQKFPPFMQQMISAGGLMKYIKKKKSKIRLRT